MKKEPDELKEKLHLKEWVKSAFLNQKMILI
jgi:hypothetical protein